MMKVITINLPNEMVDYFDYLTKKVQLFPSRSEAIRFCCLAMLPRLRSEMDTIQILTGNVEHIKLREFMEDRGYIIAKRGEYHANHKINGFEDKKALGNPFWDQYSDSQGNIHYVLKEDPNTIKVPLGDGKFKELKNMKRLE